MVSPTSVLTRHLETKQAPVLICPYCAELPQFLKHGIWVTDALFPPVLFESPARNQVEICKKEGRKGKGREGREGKGKGRGREFMK